ncbi:MAG: MFS transporter [Rhodobacteraceae bacterium]|nr:MAG: MFS transporter [Paracoccaceae bacterium]|tara:strand:- start:24 stop:1328 length:1305 start_codon:yes stop_codon:yes gene_type:complete
MTFSWLSIIRLGLVQMALGSIIAIAASTFNRVMVVELSLLQVVPGLLLALHYFVQITRPNWGFLSDRGGNRTFWIMTGICILGIGSILACFGIKYFPSNYYIGSIISIIAYCLIGLGVGASGTSLLALIATNTRDNRKAAAATITWIMMIFGAAITAIIVGKIIDPYSITKLIKIVTFLSIFWFMVSGIALYKMENKGPNKINIEIAATQTKDSFLTGLKQVLSEKNTRWFTIFVFLSMTAYFMQEPILEPYAGIVFQFTVGESTQLTGYHQGGILLGMLLVGILVSGLKFGSLRFWVLFGCAGSGLTLILIALLGQTMAGKHGLMISIALLGFFNGNFAVGAIGSMMQLAGIGRENRVGTRMGLWGAGQAIAAGNAMIFSTLFVDILQKITKNAASSYGIIFIIEGILFLAAAMLATKLIARPNETSEFSCGE